MKHKNIKYILVIFAASLLWSCKKELNVYPTTSEVDGNIIVDTKSAETVLNGVYYRFDDAGVDNNNVPSVLWTDPNEDFPSQLSGAAIDTYGGAIFTFTFDKTSADVDLVWIYGYGLVNAANGFLKNIAPLTKIAAATKTQMIAEAKFLRAFGDEELLLYYGQYYDPTSKFGIILRDEFVTTDNINLPRSGVAAAYTSILADLDAAIAGLPVLNTQICYANITAAKLLKARVLINRGATGDYAQVISLMDDVIKNSPFQLEPNVKDIFLTKGLSSKEVVLGIQPYPNESYKFQQNQHNVRYLVSDSLVSLLTNDPRNQWYYKPLPGYYVANANEMTKYFSGDPVPSNTFAAVQTPLSEYSYAFRLSEAYLMEAEATTLSNGDLSIAKNLLDTVMVHAGMSMTNPQYTAAYTVVNNANTPAALQLLIVKEELKNFAFENGADWFALRRLPFKTIQTIQPAIKDVTRLILPIPISELNENNVIQNPGY
jgi:hypothetical protein